MCENIHIIMLVPYNLSSEMLHGYEVVDLKKIYTVFKSFYKNY